LKAQLQQPGKGLNQCTSASRRFHLGDLTTRHIILDLFGVVVVVIIVVVMAGLLVLLFFVILSTAYSSSFSVPSSPFDVLLIADLPLKETVARYGPFVMNTKEERSIRL
jgi:hypothetical protein